jgi:aspartate/tyrosine/aromatic aminotransferase
MYESLQLAPPDAILGLTVAFREDPRPEKINLGVGVYEDAHGKTPKLKCVDAAERRMLELPSNPGYLSIEGLPEYNTRVRSLLLGENHEAVTGNRALTAQTPGGTGALRVAGDFIAQNFPGASVWLSKPTWANHAQIFAAAGVATKSHAYYDAANFALDFDGLIADLQKIPAGDFVLLHGCCHNPTGVDPTAAQWKKIGDVLAERRVTPLIDFAYQGFGDGLLEDAAGLLELCRPGSELLVCSSFSKNFGMYRERVGALTVIAANADTAKVAMSHVKRAIRANYSNPPYHGGAVVATVLGNQEMRAMWDAELAEMRNRINDMRKLFVDTMKKKVPQRDYSFIATQRGMFSFAGLTPAQVDELKTKHAIYIVGNGRINVAGMTPTNIERLSDAIAAVL